MQTQTQTQKLTQKLMQQQTQTQKLMKTPKLTKIFLLTQPQTQAQAQGQAQMQPLISNLRTSEGYKNYWDIPYIDPSDTSRPPLSVAGVGVGGGGRSVDRLQEQVKLLRLSGDNAMPSEGGGGSGSGGGGGGGGGRDSGIVAVALKKQLEAETAAEAARVAFKSEQKKREDLQNTLETMKRLNDTVRGVRDEKDMVVKWTQQRLVSDVAMHTENLKRIIDNKKKKLRASIVISLFLKKKVIPYFRKLISEREKANLGHALLGVFHRKHFLKTMDIRTRATLLLQKRMRGILGRKRLEKLKIAAIKVQVSGTRTF